MAGHPLDATFHHHSLGPVTQLGFYLVKSAPSHAMGCQLLQVHLVENSIIWSSAFEKHLTLGVSLKDCDAVFKEAGK